MTNCDAGWLRQPELVANMPGAYQIIAGNGLTYYGIGRAVTRIMDVLLHGRRAILLVCARIAGVPDCGSVAELASLAKLLNH